MAERLRRANLAAGVVTVFINTNRFGPEPQYANSVSHELAYSTDSTEDLLGWALAGLEKISREGYRYKKAGVMLNPLVPADQQSKRLFDAADYERSRRAIRPSPSKEDHATSDNFHRFRLALHKISK